MKQVLDPRSSRMRLGRTYKGRNWQPRRCNSEFELVEFESLIEDFISILGYGPSKPYFADPPLPHLPLPIGKKPKRSGRKSCQNQKPEAPAIIEQKADIEMAEPGTSREVQNALGLILNTEKLADSEAKDKEEYERFVLAHTNGNLEDETLF
jgi:hypothetical protein